MSDDWWDRLYTGGQRSGTRLDARPQDDAQTDAADVSAQATPHVPPPTNAPRNPSPASSWGSGRGLDPFLEEHPAHPVPGLTAEESEELRRHEDAQKKSESPQVAEIPPVPSYAPVVPGDTGHSNNTPESADGKPESEKKEDGQEEKATGWRDRFKQARTRTATATAPARSAANTALTVMAPDRGQPTSFLWVVAISITVSPQTLLTLYNKIVLIFGMPQAVAGTETGWGFLQGPGIWFGNLYTAYWESGTQYRMLLLALMGIIPIFLAQGVAHIPSQRLRKFFMWIGYGFPVFFICTPSYIPAFGYRSMTEVYVTALFAAAWWGFSFSRTVAPGFGQVLLRIPLASVLVGVVHYSPGAAF